MRIRRLMVVAALTGLLAGCLEIDPSALQDAAPGAGQVPAALGAGQGPGGQGQGGPGGPGPSATGGQAGQGGRGPGAGMGPGGQGPGGGMGPGGEGGAPGGGMGPGAEGMGPGDGEPPCDKPPACETDADCAELCPPDALGCGCADAPDGTTVCVPLCETDDDCAIGPKPLLCDVEAAICIPPAP